MKALRLLPLSVILLPLFFVLHGYAEHFSYLSARDAMLLAAFYMLISAVVFLFWLIVYRHLQKAALATVLVIGIYFFFGAIQDFLKAHAPAMQRYSVLLPLLFAAAAATLILLKRSRRPLHRLNFFLNCLLVIYLLVDISGIILKSGRPANNNSLSVKDNSMPLHDCPSCLKPDIYFLVFDAYQSSSSLQAKYGYDNSRFDRFLTGQGFRIQAASQANYKYTILSIPSILNMDYLDGLKNVKGGPVQEYDYLSGLIKKNRVTDFLRAQGYGIVNCSVFDLEENPSPVTESLLPLKTRLITDQTFYSRCIRDIGWHLFQWSDPLSGQVLDRDLRNNEKLIDEFEKAIVVPSPAPRFVYGHFNLPHPPYYFDKNGRRKPVKSVYTAEDEDDLPSYLDYLHYTNAVAERLITRIQKTTGGKAVIIFMGDHGLRYHDRLAYNPRWFLQNQNAVYFPDRDYRLLYDSISGVNQFRVVLSTLFKQNIPLLKDSTVNVKDKK